MLNKRIITQVLPHIIGARLMSNDANIFSNKETYILSKWQTDFPSHTTLTYDEISSLSSRSRDISLWFKEANDEFVLYREAPTWFLGAGKEAKDWNEMIQEKYAFIKDLNRKHTASINKVSLDAKKKMEDLESQHKAKLIEELSSTPDLVFSLFNSQMLPFEIHLKSFEYTTKEEAKEFITKQTEEFKIETYQKYLRGDLSTTDLVAMLFAKR